MSHSNTPLAWSFFTYLTVSNIQPGQPLVYWRDLLKTWSVGRFPRSIDWRLSHIELTIIKTGSADLINVSGGVDSTACYLLRLERGNDFRAVFADTGNEHEYTLDYVHSLSAKTGGPPVTVVKSDFGQHIAARRMWLEGMIESGAFQRDWTRERAQKALDALRPTGIPFLDLCMYKGRFPSFGTRFCTVELKLAAIRRQMILPAICEALKAGRNAASVVSWVGIRRDESPARANAEEWETESLGNSVYRPLVEWSKDQCFGLLKRHGVEPNPLYKLGCSRVGCMPCCLSNKDEILQIVKRWPHHIDRIREWEGIVRQCSKSGYGTFFHSATIPGDSPTRAHIDAVAEWSKTSRGGMQYDIFRQYEEPPACSSLYGLCE
jgi:3'-phosphoadenosine 5'-phosphosulfate sulfotransferase (PAPS reductase)/FAD synthetase